MATRYVFLTACRNEALILREFLGDFTAMVHAAGIADRSVLTIVDDLSTDESIAVMEEYAARPDAVPLQVVRAATNLGNQGALFHGLQQVEVEPDDVLVTFDCDGEDDVREIPSILELGRQDPGKVVLIERGRRHESLAFRSSFLCYKALYRLLTKQSVIPNNFLLIPGKFVPAIRRSPLAAVHFAYAILKLRLPSITTQRDRRPRYGGRSSQNLFMLASHGLVGLMIFYETVIAKLLALLLCSGVAGIGILAGALTAPGETLRRLLLWGSVASGAAVVGMAGLLLAAGLALMFKLTVYTLAQADARTGWPPRAAMGGTRAASVERLDRKAS